jgi:glycosyltransferase involved in cell wall biosynthesis
MVINVPAVAEFSVLMPIYIKEAPAFFDTALRSVVTQSLMPSEILIIEDGPITEELEKVIANYQKEFPGLFIIIKQEENKGMGFTMTAGLKACKYNLVARMDSDDIALPNRFEQQIRFLVDHPDIDVLGSCIEEFDDTPGDMKRLRQLPSEHEQLVKMAKFRCPFNHMTVVFKKDKVLNAGAYWERRSLEDYHLWYQMIKSGCKLHNMQETLVYARVGNNMLGRRRGLEYLKNERFFFKIMKKDKFITFVQYYQCIIGRTILRLIPQNILGLFYEQFLRK